MVNLIHCAELVITGINYAACDGTYKLNDTCAKDSSCDIGGSGGWPLHFSRGDASNGRQMWWCGKGDDDPAGAYSCTPWETTPCGGSFGATNKEGAGYSCTQCAAGWGGEDCKVSQTGWGGLMIILTAIALAGYIGGGVTLGVRKNGAAPALSAHPHHERWAEFAGLCRDGVRFTQRQLRGADGRGGSGGSSRAPLISAERGSPSKSKAGKPKGSGKAEKKRHKKDAKHQHASSDSPSRSSGGGSSNNSGGDLDLTAAAARGGDASGLSQQQLQEQRFVAGNLHESQAKIAVVGLNEM
jgi:hypothetical protein